MSMMSRVIAIANTPSQKVSRRETLVWGSTRRLGGRLGLGRPFANVQTDERRRVSATDQRQLTHQEHHLVELGQLTAKREDAPLPGFDVKQASLVGVRGREHPLRKRVPLIRHEQHALT